MNNRSITEIKEDINSRMKTLGKLIIVRYITCILSITSAIISMYNFVLIFWKVGKENDAINVGGLCILFMIISLVFIALYAIIINICTELKRKIYNDKRILKRLK